VRFDEGGQDDERSTMRRIDRKVIALVATTVVMVVGAGAAIAAGTGSGAGDNADLKAAAAGLEARDAFRKGVAERLGVTVAQLETAVTEAATERIDAAEQAGDITAAEADSLRAAVADGHLARRIADPAVVAQKLGTTEEKLRAAVTAEQKEQAKARVDQAVADGKITKEYGEELKAQIDAGERPGRGAGMGGPHHGHGYGGLGGGHRMGGGFEPGGFGLGGFGGDAALKFPRFGGHLRGW
jgi:hypothetical protein